MEDKCIPFRLIRLSVAVHACHLSRGKENQRSFLVIISMPTIHQITAFYIFQKDGVETEIHTGTLSWGCLRQVNHTYQRVECFIVVESIVIIDCFKPSHAIHIVLTYTIQNYRLAHLSLQEPARISN